MTTPGRSRRPSSRSGPAGSKPPLFLAHGVSGLLFRYLHLVRRLDPDQPVYGLQPTARFVDSPRRLRIEDLASRYVEDILRIQPAGPYRLAGFCFGGVVVMEVAHQLEQLGHAVDTLALFDAEPPTAPQASRARREATAAGVARPPSRDRVGLPASTAREREGEASTPAVAGRSVAPRAHRSSTARSLGRPRPVHSAQADPLWRSLSRALASYVAPTTSCTVTLFRAGDPTADRPRSGSFPVDDGPGECYVIDGPGVAHGTLMEEPHVGALATALTQLLDRAADHGRRIVTLSLPSTARAASWPRPTSRRCTYQVECALARGWGGSWTIPPARPRGPRSRRSVGRRRCRCP